MSGPISIAKKIWPTSDAEFLLSAKPDIERALSALPERDRAVVKRRHGFDGPPEKLTKVASSTSMSVARISQIEKGALALIKLRVEQAQRGPMTGANVRLEDLELTARVRRLLSQAGVSSIHAVCQHPPSFYKRLPGFGETSLENLESELQKYGLALRKES